MFLDLYKLYMLSVLASKTTILIQNVILIMTSSNRYITFDIVDVRKRNWEMLLKRANEFISC